MLLLCLINYSSQNLILKKGYFLTNSIFTLSILQRFLGGDYSLQPVISKTPRKWF